MILRKYASPMTAFAQRHQCSKRFAVIDFGWMRIRGRVAWWIRGLAHIYFLIGVRNRLAVAHLFRLGPTGEALPATERPSSD